MSIMKKTVDKLYKSLYDKMNYDTFVKAKMMLLPGFRRVVTQDEAIYQNNFDQANEMLSFRKNSVSKGIDGVRHFDEITMVFLCQFPGVWNGMESVYQAAKETEGIRVYCLALPEKLMDDNYDVSWEKYGENEALPFLETKGIDVIDAGNPDKGWFDLTSLKPNYVFLPRPYNIHLPENYRSYTISAYSRVCYIPYGYDSTIGDSKLSYEFEFMKHVYAAFAENDYYAKQLHHIYKSVHWKNKKIYNLGYPRFDLYRDYLEKKDQIHSAPDHKKTVLWLPRWTTDDQFEATTFFDYKDFFVKYFTKNSDVQFICRPHPLMFRNFVSSGDMTEEEVAEFKKHFETKNNFILDSDGDYTKSLEAADVIISDYTSLIIEELLMDVPVIYTGSTKHFGKKAKANAVGLYQLDSRKDMNKVLTGLLKGVDPMKAIRHEVAKSIYPDEPMTVGQKMVEALMEDYKEIK